MSLSEGADEEAWMKQYRLLGADVVKIADYVQDTYAQTLSQLQLAARVILAIGVLVIAAVLGLFSRLTVERNRYAISLRKALGFTSGECERDAFIEGMIPNLLGAAAGLLLGCPGGEGLCALVLKSFGAESFRFVINPGQALVGIPLLALGTAALAIGAGIRGIRKIKACECCMGKE